MHNKIFIYTAVKTTKLINFMALLSTCTHTILILQPYSFFVLQAKKRPVLIERMKYNNEGAAAWHKIGY
jgi:hypothetical protein